MTTQSEPININDYVSIQRLINRYADAVIHRTGAQWASCWADDAVWDLGGGRLVEGKDAIVKLWYAAMGGISSVVQNVHNGEVWQVSGDSAAATGRWTISERFKRADGATGIFSHITTMHIAKWTDNGSSQDAFYNPTITAQQIFLENF